jgi:hypothetical protein
MPPADARHGRQAGENAATTCPLDHDDCGLKQSTIMNVVDFKDLERDRRSSSRNLRELDCAGKPRRVPLFLSPLWRGLVGHGPPYLPRVRGSILPQSGLLRGLVWSREMSDDAIAALH